MNLRKGIGPNVVSGIAVTGLLAAMIFLMVGTTDRDAKIDRLSAGNDALYAQVKDQGEIPVAPPAKTVTGDAGKDGQLGPRGFTGDQGPRGDTGDTGADGVVGLLGAVGPVGSNGLNGLDGMTGAAGADGSNGAPGADGATGAKGATGVDGDTGRGVAEVACQDDGDWLFTMTDESSITVTGPCRVGIPATPKETP